MENVKDRNIGVLVQRQEVFCIYSCEHVLVSMFVQKLGVSVDDGL